MSSISRYSAFLRRELRVVTSSRLALFVPVAGIAAGVAAAFSAGPADIPMAAPLFLLQVLLYVFPLLGILAATGSAHSEQDESLLLAALPVGRMQRATGKFSGLMACFLISLLLMTLPALIVGMHLLDALRILGYGAGISAFSVAAGLLFGFAIPDGVKAHMVALGFWLLLLLVPNLAGWLMLYSPDAKAAPLLWSLLMMLSPLDALRVGILFSVEAVPFNSSRLPGLVQWWLGNLGTWFAILCTTLTTAVLALAAKAGTKAA